MSWRVVAGATKYVLYRSTSIGGVYTVVSTTAALSYTNMPVNTGTTYYYKVRAYRLVSSTKVYGPYSTIVSAKTALTAPMSVKAVRVSSTSIKMSWKTVAGATKYEVWRSTSSAGTYSLIATTGNLYCTNTGLYYYRVRAYRLVGSTKVYSTFPAYSAAKP